MTASFEGDGKGQPRSMRGEWVAGPDSALPQVDRKGQPYYTTTRLPARLYACETGHVSRRDGPCGHNENRVLALLLVRMGRDQSGPYALPYPFILTPIGVLYVVPAAMAMYLLFQTYT